MTVIICSLLPGKSATLLPDFFYKNKHQVETFLANIEVMVIGVFAILTWISFIHKMCSSISLDLCKPRGR